MSERERWKCKCGAVLQVLPDPNPKLVWKDLKCKDAPVASWDFSNEQWWHYHTGVGKNFDKGYVPAKRV